MSESDLKHEYDENDRPSAADPMERIRAGGAKGGHRIHEMAAQRRGEDPEKAGMYTQGGRPTSYQASHENTKPSKHEGKQDKEDDKEEEEEE
eukprot:jgi/Chlat1/7466/Chrsp6S07474